MHLRSAGFCIIHTGMRREASALKYFRNFYCRSATAAFSGLRAQNVHDWKFPARRIDMQTNSAK